jgi:hypothetical protein
VADERRRHVRKQVDLAATLEYDETAVDCHVSDMSAGGTSIDLVDPPAFGTRVRLRVVLPDGPELALEGVVRWRRATEIGVQFAPMGARQTYHLTEFLAQMDALPDSRLFGS